MGITSDSGATSLADALFPTTRQKVLGLVFGQPWRDFGVSELITLADVGSGAVQRELKRLTSSGLVTVTHVGKLRRYRANPDSPIYDELCSIVRKVLGAADLLRAALEPLADQIELAVLFGSVAKGTDTANSDIDLLVVADNLTMENLFSALEAVESTLDRPVQPTLYTTEELRQRRKQDSPFIRNVLGGEHVVLWGAVSE